ncbi:ankyrin repeat domain-containing protein 40 isoform X1 [Lepisosteus oculatus]|uniref:ankyrin repeat domain-containing protein 40 isoform X1 n=1 Tax=Lepisosteus oculatus TaxID=7918 RepID=UPI00371A5AB5
MFKTSYQTLVPPTVEDLYCSTETEEIVSRRLQTNAPYCRGPVEATSLRTCLHWACKRNHRQIVAYLLSSGADTEVLTSKGEKAAQLTSRRDIRKLLGVEEDEIEELTEVELPIIPNYLVNPPFPYVKTEKPSLIPEAHVPSHNGTVGTSEVSHCEQAPLPALEKERNPFADASIPRESAYIPVAEQNGLQPSSLGSVNGTTLDSSHSNHSEHSHKTTQNGPVCSTLLSPNGNPSSSVSASSGRQQSIPQQLNCNQMGSMPAFQPFFFTSAFPLNMQELVLKVRVQNPSVRENDFIEVELDRQELTYRSLLRVCCRELGVSADHVEKIRKLPNTMLRKDKDVARLQDFQELEVVLEKTEGLALFSATGQSSLTDKPCYNMKASKLTY